MRPLETGDPTSVGQGRYRLVGRLGQGGMGVVYFGRSLSGRAVAVKVVRPELSTEPGFRRRFADEVAAARKVGGFHTAPVVDADPDGDPAWLVTAFVPGPTLQSVLLNVGVLPVGTVTVLAAGLAEALEAIHRVGVMHRDLKPANIIVAEDGPRVIDFGIARALDGTALTQTGLQIGTPGYLAPEQLTGGAVTPAVDMFALGVVLSQAVGAFPFGDGPSAARHYRVVHEEPDLAAVPPELRPLIADCLAKIPADRPSPADFLARLTVQHLPDGDWLPAAATAMLRRIEPLPTNTPDTYQAAASAAAGGAAHPETVKATPPPEHPQTVRAAHADPAPGPTGPASDGAAGAGGAVGAAAFPGSAYPQAPDTPPPPGGQGGTPSAFGPPAAPYSAGTVRPRRRRALLVALAVLVVAGTAAGLLVAQPWSGDAGTAGNGSHAAGTGSPSSTGSTSAPAAPAALPAQPLLVREDTAPGFPQTCHGVIAVRAPGRDDPRRLVSGGSCDELPQWSPDRTRFAFTRTTAGSSAVWVADADGSNPHEVAPVQGGRATWSPDGERLGVVRRTKGVQQFWTVNAADGSALQITHGTAGLDDPSWSPDGTRIAVWKDVSGLSQIFLIDLAHPDAAPVQITHGSERARDPMWSPDGRFLVYTYGKPLSGSQGDIHVVGADGSGDRPLAASGDQEMDPSWSPDGKWVAYVRGPVETPAVWAVRADGTGARKLTTGNVPEGHPSWR
ncbi:serine/threonine-protein kinase [Streptomyces sp. NBC_01476]|uniref:protein kinase domain-containing protein n=1 Tax=Streptomyces sp. NBC_01476 TaxID=2903881 RepID=UPI002E339BD4|nr:protein kinase [Streptomyces sp. NBC_01476]